MKDKLIALALTFSIVTEGLTVAQLQEALDANAGYQAFLAKQKDLDAAVEVAKAAEAKAKALEGELAAANQKAADVQTELDQANETIESLAQDVTAATTDPNAVFFTDEDGDEYEIIQPVFRFRGTEYKSAEAVDKHPEVLQELVEAKSFILKRK